MVIIIQQMLELKSKQIRFQKLYNRSLRSSNLAVLRSTISF